MTNAVKFTHKGQIKLSVSAQKTPDGDDKLSTHMVSFSVKDTGIGIPNDKKEEIFKAFTQVDPSTTRRYGGTGLGLNIVMFIVRAMKGELKLFSEEGEGSEFIVSLRLKAGVPVKDVDIELIPSSEIKGKKVMIIDDDKDSRKILSNYTDEAYMDIVNVAVSAEDAFVQLGSSSELPNIVLCDVHMPGIDGYAFVKSLKEKDKYTSIKVIAIDSDAKPSTAKLAQEAGFNGYLPKPIIKADLIKVIRAVLGDKRLAGQIVTRHMADELFLKGMDLLVVEDDTVNQKLIKVLLDKLGCKADVALDGRQAIEKLKQKQYDAVLMDLVMPVMGGVEATEVIRRDISKDLPIIALTAATTDADKEKTRGSGIDGYLIKPIQPNRLKEELLRCRHKG